MDVLAESQRAARRGCPRFALITPELSIERALRDALHGMAPKCELEVTLFPEEGTEALSFRSYAGVLLDLRLGRPAAARICSQFLRIPGRPLVIMIGEPDDLLGEPDADFAFSAGADDYVADGPGMVREMSARLRALMHGHRRPSASAGTLLGCGPLKIDLTEQGVTVHEESIELTKVQWLLLVRLVRDAGTPIRHLELCRFARVQEQAGNANLRVAIDGLRRRLGPAASMIRAVRGSGYAIVPPRARSLHSEESSASESPAPANVGKKLRDELVHACQSRTRQ